jgi:hypothetical protein
MEVSTWCDNHNLPPPTDGGAVPVETAIYFAVCLSRRDRELPAEVVACLILLTRGVVAAEA